MVSLEKNEKRIFTLHLIYSLIEGVILGAFMLNEFIFVKSLHGSKELLGVLFQITAIFLIASIIINEIQRRYNKKKILVALAFLTRTPLAILAFFPSSAAELTGASFWHIIFLGVFFLYYMANPMIYPTINHYLKSNYQKMHFGKLYSYATSANKVVMLISTFLFGILLDYDNYAFRYVYPIIAVLGITSIFLLSRMDDGNGVAVVKRSIRASVKNSIWSMVGIIKTNRPFRDFEIGFMLYGFAFMITISVITLFMTDVLELNYSSIAIYKNIYNIQAIILLPFFGKLMDKIDPRKFGMITFLSLLLYVFFVGLTEYFPQHTYLWNIKIYYMFMVSLIFHGFFAATMSLLWSIGSSYFGSEGNAADYQSVHLSLVGVRAIIAPLLGIYFLELFGFTPVFVIGIGFLALAILQMYISMKRDPIDEKE